MARGDAAGAVARREVPLAKSKPTTLNSAEKLEARRAFRPSPSVRGRDVDRQAVTPLTDYPLDAAWTPPDGYAVGDPRRVDGDGMRLDGDRLNADGRRRRRGTRRVIDPGTLPAPADHPGVVKPVDPSKTPRSYDVTAEEQRATRGLRVGDRAVPGPPVRAAYDSEGSGVGGGLDAAVPGDRRLAARDGDPYVPTYLPPESPPFDVTLDSDEARRRRDEAMRASGLPTTDEAQRLRDLKVADELRLALDRAAAEAALLAPPPTTP